MPEKVKEPLDNTTKPDKVYKSSKSIIERSELSEALQYQLN